MLEGQEEGGGGGGSGDEASNDQPAGGAADPVAQRLAALQKRLDIELKVTNPCRPPPARL